MFKSKSTGSVYDAESENKMNNTEDYDLSAEKIADVEEGKDNWFYVTTEDHWSIGIQNPQCLPLPVAGDTVTMFWKNGAGWGGTLTGARANGHHYFYKTRAELEQERLDYLQEIEERKSKTFDDNFDKWMERKNKLLPALRRRIERFEEKEGRNKFWYQDGAYELFILEQSQILYNNAIQHENPIAWINHWQSLDYKEQIKFAPGVSDDHSGWTWGAMVAMAKALLEGTEV